MTPRLRWLVMLSVWLVITLPAHAWTDTVADASSAGVSLMLGHSSSISALVISPNGRLLATSSLDKTTLIWDIKSAIEMRSLVHPTSVSSVAFVTDTKVATGMNSGAVVLWDVETGNALKTVSFTSAVTNLYASPDQRFLWCVTALHGVFVLTAQDLKTVVHYADDRGAAVTRRARSDGSFGALRWGVSGAVVEWWKDTEITGRIRLKPRRTPTAGALTPDGQMVALGTEDGSVELASGHDFSNRAVYSGHRGSVTSLEISPAGVTFASAGTDGSVLVQATKNGRQIRKIPVQELLQAKALYASEQRLVVANGEDNSAQLITLTSGSTLNFRGLVSRVFSLDSSRDRRYLTTAGWHVTSLWDSVKGTSQMLPLNGSASAATISPDGAYVFTSESLPYDYSHHVITKDARTGKEIRRVSHAGATVTAAVYSADGRLLIVGDSLGNIQLYNARTGRAIRALTGHSARVTSLALGPERTLLSSAADHTARVWSLDTGIERWQETTIEGSEVFSPDGTLLAAWWAGDLRVFDVKTHHEVLRVKHVGAKFAFVGNDTLLYVDEQTSMLKSWFRRTGKTQDALKLDIADATLIPLTDRLVLACGDGVATVVDWKAQTFRHSFDHASCSPAGAPYVIVFVDNQSEVWNAVSLKRRFRFPEGERFHSFSFSTSANGETLVTTNGDFQAKNWNLTTGKLVSSDKDEFRRVDSLRSGLPALAANRDRYLVSQSTDGPPMSVVNRWPTGARGKPQKVATTAYAIRSLNVSPDGEWLLICASESIQLVHMNDRGGATPKIVKFPCVDARFSPDGKLITAASFESDRPAVVWSGRLDQNTLKFDYRPSQVAHLAVSRNGTRMLTAEGVATLRMWDLIAGAEQRSLESIKFGEQIESVELVLNGAMAVAGLNTGEIRTWTTSTGRAVQNLMGHKGGVFSVRRARSNDQVFVSAGMDGSVRVWDVLGMQVFKAFDNPPGTVTAAAPCPDGTQVVIGFGDGSVEVRDVSAGTVLHSFVTPTLVRSVACNPTKDGVLIGGEDGVARLVDLTTEITVREFRSRRPEPITSVDHFGDVVLISTRSGTTLWGVSYQTSAIRFPSEDPVAESRVYLDESQSVSVVHGGKNVRTARLGVFGFSEGNIFSERLLSIAAHPDGSHLLTGYSSGWMRLWNTDSGSIVGAWLVPGGDTEKLRYSRSGDRVLMLVGGKPHMWDIKKAALVRDFRVASQVTDMTFAGDADQFVLIASGDGQVHVFDEASGIEVCALVSGKNSQWLVVSPDGLFDGSDAFVSAVVAFRSGTGGAGAGRLSPGLLSAIFKGRVPLPLGPFIGVASPTQSAQTVQLQSGKAGDSIDSVGRTISTDRKLDGLGLMDTINVFANLLGVKSQVRINDGSRIETLPDGTILVGTAALDRVLVGRSFGGSLGLLAFVLAHESWHSRQSGKYKFGELSAEDQRLLECEADVLGTIDALKITTTLGKTPEGLEAYFAVRQAQAQVVAMSALEASDSSHPTQAQREQAVEFGNARFAARVLTDEEALAIFARRYDALGEGDDESWAEAVCKRVLNHKLTSQANVAISLRDQRRVGDTWVAEVVYLNLTSTALRVSAQVRLVGLLSSILSDGVVQEATIDAQLLSFVLPPHGERIERVALGAIGLRSERVQASDIVYSSVQNGNLMSVEVVTDSEFKQPERAASRAVVNSGSEKSVAARTCVDDANVEPVNASQRDLGVFLFRAAAHALDGFQRLKVGGGLVVSAPTSPTEAAFAADIKLPEAESVVIIADGKGGANLHARLGSNLSMPEAEGLFKSVSEGLRFLCSTSRFTFKSLPDRPTRFEQMTVPHFARNAEVDLMLLRNEGSGRADVTLTVHARGPQ